MPRNQGVRHEQWTNCDRCGFPHPVGMLTMQKGLRLCSDHGCLDDLSVEYRERIIQEVLQTEEGIDERAEQFNDPGELVF
jgi:hypothetical protein